MKTDPTCKKIMAFHHEIALAHKSILTMEKNCLLTTIYSENYKIFSLVKVIRPKENRFRLKT